jgi:hypothetical protein
MATSEYLRGHGTQDHFIQSEKVNGSAMVGPLLSASSPITYNDVVARGLSKMSRAIRPSRIERVDNDLARVLRTKSAAERVEMIAAANRTARVLAAAGIRFQHPDWSEEQVHAEVIRRVCGGTE